MTRVLLDDGRSVEFAFEHFTRLAPGIEIQAVTSCDLIVRKPTDDSDAVDVQEFHGEAFCSTGDVFVKDIGRKIALTRALKQSGLDKNARWWVWDRYFLRWMTNKQYHAVATGQRTVEDVIKEIDEKAMEAVGQ